MTAYQVDQRRARAFIWDVNEPVLRHLLKQLAREMSGSARAGRGLRERPR